MTLNVLHAITCLLHVYDMRELYIIITVDVCPDYMHYMTDYMLIIYHLHEVYTWITCPSNWMKFWSNSFGIPL